MAILRSEVRPEILRQNCHRCGLAVPAGSDPFLSFAEGKFVIFHDECWQAESAEMERAVVSLQKAIRKPRRR